MITTVLDTNTILPATVSALGRCARVSIVSPRQFLAILQAPAKS